MKTILTILLLTLSIATYADRSAVVNGYGNLQGYKATEGCYGTGCLPTAVLQEVLKQPSYYSQERIQNERLIDELKESNEINKERLKLELENSNQE
jgi:cell shape-determining protein MreC